MSGAAESLVLVEGFDDRDFWKGLLLHLGCKEARKEPVAAHRQSPGFTYLMSSGALVHVIPFKALPGISKGAELQGIVAQKLKARTHKPFQRLVVSPDADLYLTRESAAEGVGGMVLATCPDAKPNEDGDWLVDGGKFIVSAVFIHADAAKDGEGQWPAGVPAQPALEQLACAALCRVYPDRGRAVAAWLGARPAPTGKDHKAHAWSFYAGWSTDHGPGDFYGSLWRDEKIAAELRALLEKQRAWRVIEALVA